MGYDLHDYGIPRGHRGIKTNVDIAVRDEDGDNFTDNIFVQVNIIWDTPGASLVRHIYRSNELGLTVSIGQIFMESFNVPLQGQIELIAIPVNIWQIMALRAGGVDQSEMILGRCPIHPQRQRTLRIVARRVGFTRASQTSSGYNSANTQGARLGAQILVEGTGITGGGEGSHTGTTLSGRSQTDTHTVGLGRFEMSQI